MADITKICLSGSTDGLPIKVTGTDYAGRVTIHTAGSGTTNRDEMFIYAHADDAQASTVKLTMVWDNGTDPDDLMHVTLPAFGSAGNDGMIPIITGLPLQNSKVLSAYAATANVVLITGWVNRHDNT